MVMIYTMMCQSPPVPSFIEIHLPVPEKKILFRFLPYNGHGIHLGHVTWTIHANFGSSFLRVLHITFGFDWSNSF